MIENFQPNPLNTFGLRELEHCPPHFFPVDFECLVNEKHIKDWIYENLSGRFYLADIIVQGHFYKRAAFEVHSEASYFAMLLNDLNQKSSIF